MKSARVIAVGKLKISFWQEACAYYLRRLKPWREIAVTEIRDGDATTVSERKRQEGERILAVLKGRELLIVLTEKGKMPSSTEFAEFLRNCDEKLQQTPVFIIGGPFGLDDSVLQVSDSRLGLSKMTWPHELCRVLLMEQLYRAESILHNSRYHH